MEKCSLLPARWLIPALGLFVHEDGCGRVTGEPTVSSVGFGGSLLGRGGGSIFILERKGWRRAYVSSWGEESQARGCPCLTCAEGRAPVPARGGDMPAVDHAGPASAAPCTLGPALLAAEFPFVDDQTQRVPFPAHPNATSQRAQELLRVPRDGPSGWVVPFSFVLHCGGYQPGDASQWEVGAAGLD